MYPSYEFISKKKNTPVKFWRVLFPSTPPPYSGENFPSSNPPPKMPKCIKPSLKLKLKKKILCV